MCSRAEVRARYLASPELRERQRAYGRQYRQDHKEYFRSRARLRVRVKVQGLVPKSAVRSEINYKLANMARNRVYGALRAKGIKSKYMGGSATGDLGCSLAEFRGYVEAKFKPGMTWENNGKGQGKWFLDNVVPLATFDLTDRKQFLKACHYTNYEPLWSEYNPRKSKKIEALSIRRGTTI